MAFDSYSGGAAYVVNYDSNSVSVINTTTHSKIGEDIPVGDEPVDIIIVGNDPPTLYVSNFASNSVSVINTTTHSKIGEDIPVGDNPADLEYDYIHDVVYVANMGSDSISVIDGETNKVLAGVTFHVNPFNSGYIVCDDATTPSPMINSSFSNRTISPMYILALNAQLKPNEGFEFVKLGGELRRIIQLN